MFHPKVVLTMILLAPVLSLRTPALAQQDQRGIKDAPVGTPPPGKSNEIDILDLPPVPNEVAPKVNIPNYTICGIDELERIVPELRGLRTSVQQERLTDLLDKVGAKTLDIARKMPDLISLEAVEESKENRSASRQEFSYLILSHVGKDVVTFDEFRVDLKSGERFQTGDLQKAAPVHSPSTVAEWAELAQATERQAASESGHAPICQGFANAWLFFYPTNRHAANFRLLGQQKMDGHRTLVVAFAQKPKEVRLPAQFRYEGRSGSMFFQGVAWIDSSDFRIVRLRSDLLPPLPDPSLQRLTADAHFMETTAADVPSPLWLPHEVMVTSEVQGIILRDHHWYSDYRLFRVRSKIVLNP